VPVDSGEPFAGFFVRAHLSCAFLEIVDGVLRVVSTDGHTLAQREAAFDGSFAGITIPQKSAIDVRRTLEAIGSDELQIGTRLGYLFLVSGGIEVSIKLGDGNFIPYKRVIPHTKKRRATVPREATLAAIKRVLSNIDDASPTAQLSFSDGSLAIRSSTKDAEASDAVDIDYAGDDFRISANGAYLIRALGAMAHDEAWIDTSSELDPIVIRGRDSTESVHVVMPVRQ
jgi:DNA polymerase-3 subunit beta